VRQMSDVCGVCRMCAYITHSLWSARNVRTKSRHGGQILLFHIFFVSDRRSSKAEPKIGDFFPSFF
jgi:hypothetical protein